MGLDRIDNSIGHMMANCLPACGDCNVARGDRFSVDEMMGIGSAIAAIRHNRLLALQYATVPQSIVINDQLNA